MPDSQQPAREMAGRCSLQDLIHSLRWARLQLVFRAEETLHLPAYAGSTFRGAFGHAFRRVACPLQRECAGCGYRVVCVYAYVVETSGSAAGSPVTRSATAAHPFVLEPPEAPMGEVRPGEAVTLGLVLVGRAIPLAPYFLAASREMGQRGFGPGRGRLRLERAVADDPADGDGRVVFDGDRDLLAPAVRPWRSDDLGEDRRAADRVTLEFLTPTRLRQDADLVVRPEFATLS